jgi:hypothetical protein
LLCLLVGLTGCPEEGDDTLVGTCTPGTVTVNGAAANNAFGDFSFAADQCDIDTIDGMLEIDMLDRGVADGDPVPRVLFTLEVTVEELEAISAGDAVNIDLARTDETLPQPAIYQDLLDNGSDPADGNFWTSISGSMVFDEDMDGNLVGTFNFEADNPPNPNPDNTAEGTLSVVGTVTVVLSESGEGEPCGLGSGMMATMTLTGLWLMRTRRIRRRRKG